MKIINKKLNQRGLVTIVSVIIIIIIITIITLSLSALTRRGLRQSLDEQLSTQAQYAAESGVNAAIKLINKNDGTIPAGGVNSCDLTGSDAGDIFKDNLLSDSVKYSCVLVDLASDEISTDLTNETMKVYKLENSGGTAINRLTIAWSNNPANTTTPTECATKPSCLTNQPGWESRPGLLRVKLIPYPASGFQRDGIAGIPPAPTTNSAIDITAYPFAITTTTPLLYGNTANASTNKNHVLEASCNGSGECSIVVTDLSTPGRYYVQLYSYYASKTNVKIKGFDSASTAVRFSGAQATIDSTGISQDVVKRLRVKVALDASSNLPIYTLGSGESLCKRFTTNATITTDVGAAASCSAF